MCLARNYGLGSVTKAKNEVGGNGCQPPCAVCILHGALGPAGASAGRDATEHGGGGREGCTSCSLAIAGIEERHPQPCDLMGVSAGRCLPAVMRPQFCRQGICACAGVCACMCAAYGASVHCAARGSADTDTLYIYTCIWSCTAYMRKLRGAAPSHPAEAGHHKGLLLPVHTHTPRICHKQQR